MTHTEGDVRIRSNVTDRAAWNLVPGELLRRWKPRLLETRRGEATHLQRDQDMYHKPCYCGRLLFDVEVFGCDDCPYKPTARVLDDRQREWRRTIDLIRELERSEQADIEAERSGRSLDA